MRTSVATSSDRVPGDAAVDPSNPPGPSHAPPAVGSVVWLGCKLAGIVLFALHHHRLAALVFFAPDPWMFWQMAVPWSRGFGPVITHFATTEPEVWLTIDDGPHPESTPQILDLLDRFGARATFFVVGKRVEEFPGVALEIVARGHTVANHSTTHPVRSFWAAGPGRTRVELDRCAGALARAGVRPLPYFRPPVGLKNPWLHAALAERALACVNWSSRGYDRILKLDTAVRRIARQIQPGAIVLLHDGDFRSVRVVERVLENLHTRHYTAVIPARNTLR